MSNPSITFVLTDNEVKMIQAFAAWKVDSPMCSPKRHQIEYGYGSYFFSKTKRIRDGFYANDLTGPHTFDRLKVCGLIKHSPNGHFWLTEIGKDALRQIERRAEVTA